MRDPPCLSTRVLRVVTKWMSPWLRWPSRMEMMWWTTTIMARGWMGTRVSPMLRRLRCLGPLLLWKVMVKVPEVQGLGLVELVELVLVLVGLVLVQAVLVWEVQVRVQVLMEKRRRRMVEMGMLLLLLVLLVPSLLRRSLKIQALLSRIPLRTKWQTLVGVPCFSPHRTHQSCRK